MLIYLDEIQAKLLLGILGSNLETKDIVNQIKEGLKNYERKKHNC